MKSGHSMPKEHCAVQICLLGASHAKIFPFLFYFLLLKLEWKKDKG
jgi:hypothetical protein